MREKKKQSGLKTQNKRKKTSNKNQTKPTSEVPTRKRNSRAEFGPNTKIELIDPKSVMREAERNLPTKNLAFQY